MADAMPDEKKDDDRFGTQVFGRGMGYGFDISGFLTGPEGRALAATSKGLRDAVKHNADKFGHYPEKYMMIKKTLVDIDLNKIIEVLAKVVADLSPRSELRNIANGSKSYMGDGSTTFILHVNSLQPYFNEEVMTYGDTRKMLLNEPLKFKTQTLLTPHIFISFDPRILPYTESKKSMEDILKIIDSSLSENKEVKLYLRSTNSPLGRLALLTFKPEVVHRTEPVKLMSNISKPNVQVDVQPDLPGLRERIGQRTKQSEQSKQKSEQSKDKDDDEDEDKDKDKKTCCQRFTRGLKRLVGIPTKFTARKKTPKKTPKKAPKKSFKKAPKKTPKKSLKKSLKKSIKKAPKKTPKKYVKKM